MVPKVFLVGRFLIGCTGGFRLNQVLQHHLAVVPQGDEPDEAYMVQTFAESVRVCLKVYGVSEVSNNVESGGIFLVGYHGRLYLVDSDFQVNEMQDGFDACGCGAPWALGAMAALVDLPPRERIERALQIAEHFSGGVRGPFTILEEGNDGHSH